MAEKECSESPDGYHCLCYWDEDEYTEEEGRYPCCWCDRVWNSETQSTEWPLI